MADTFDEDDEIFDGDDEIIRTGGIAAHNRLQRAKKQWDGNWFDYEVIVSSSLSTPPIPLVLVSVYIWLDGHEEISICPVVAIRTAIMEFYTAPASLDGPVLPPTIGSRDTLERAGWTYAESGEQTAPVILKDGALLIFTPEEARFHSSAWAVCLASEVDDTKHVVVAKAKEQRRVTDLAATAPATATDRPEGE